MPIPKYWLLVTVHQHRHRPSGSNTINGTNLLYKRLPFLNEKEIKEWSQKMVSEMPYPWRNPNCASVRVLLILNYVLCLELTSKVKSFLDVTLINRNTFVASRSVRIPFLMIELKNTFHPDFRKFSGKNISKKIVKIRFR